MTGLGPGGAVVDYLRALSRGAGLLPPLPDRDPAVLSAAVHEDLHTLTSLWADPAFDRLAAATAELNCSWAAAQATFGEPS